LSFAAVPAEPESAPSRSALKDESATTPHDEELEGPVLPADPLTGDPIRVTTAAISSYAKLLLERDEANAEVARLTAALRDLLALADWLREGAVFGPEEQRVHDTARALAGEATDTPRGAIEPFEDAIARDVLATAKRNRAAALPEGAVPAVPEHDWTEGPCEPTAFGCTGAPHRTDCPERTAASTDRPTDPPCVHVNTSYVSDTESYCHDCGASIRAGE
jgi:hypothetical protein